MEVARRILTELPMKLSLGKHGSCKICGSPTEPFDAVDFYKHCSSTPYLFGFSGVCVPYFRCRNCDFTATNAFDAWSHEDFSRWIYNDQYTKVDPDYAGPRAIGNAWHISRILEGLNGVTILDYGSGAGVFRDEMCKAGFSHVEEYDPFSHPSRPEVQYFDVITCFEVLEHSLDPLKTLSEMLSMLKPGGIIIFSQTFQPVDFDAIKCNWWYAAPRNGHVSTFSERTFSYIAQRLGIRFHWGPDIYALIKPPFDDDASNAIAERLGRVLYAPLATNSFWQQEYCVFGPFRWSARQDILWENCAFSSGHHLVIIPFFFEARLGFSEGCKVFVGDREWPVRRNRFSFMIQPQFESDAVVDVRLSTPAPCQLPYQPEDCRVLGLAIPDKLC